jgi:hypothetical protein
MLEVTVVERFDLDRARLWAAHTDGPRADANRARTGDLRSPRAGRALPRRDAALLPLRTVTGATRSLADISLLLAKYDPPGAFGATTAGVVCSCGDR